MLQVALPDGVGRPVSERAYQTGWVVCRVVGQHRRAHDEQVVHVPSAGVNGS
jgi:hypothetical protein